MSDIHCACFISCSAELMITNQELATTKIQLHDVIFHKDINNLPDSLFQVGETNEGGNGSTLDVVSALPFSSDAFCQYYKVSKLTHLTFACPYSYFGQQKRICQILQSL